MPPLKPDRRPSGARHDSSLPEWAVEKMARRRGRRHAFDRLEPARTALVVIDLMESVIASTPCAASIVAPVARLAASLRALGGTVAWVRPAPLPAASPNLEALWGSDHLRKHVAQTAEGHAGKELAAGLDPEPGDLLVEKAAYSAFFPGRCRLPELLQARGVDTVIVTGVLTNICCESSARDAATLGFRVVMVADANAARSDEEHRAALYNILRNFGDVRMTEELIADLTRRAGRKHAGAAM